MLQPELGRRLVALRKEKNLTQEQLVALSHVSVRTIQRIESGEVMPRKSTVKILFESVGANVDSLSNETNTSMESSTGQSNLRQINTLLTAAIAGAIYLAAEISLTSLDMLWFFREGAWEPWLNWIYVGLTAVMVTAYALFIRGFLVLSRVFENKLLTIAAYLMVAAVAGSGMLDISTLGTEDVESLWIPYSAAAMIVGALSLVFGAGLLRLQDGMGEISRIAGILEIVMGCSLVTVVFFFFSYVVFVPAVVLEILLLYKGYEYLSRPPVVEA